MTTNCANCAAPTIIERDWRANPDQRETWKAAGYRCRGSRGLCAACYRTAHNRGLLDQYAAQPGTRALPLVAHPCPRCGIRTRAADVCSDCQQVVGDLGEAETWGAA